MNWNNGKCRHGFVVEVRPHPRGKGWVQEFAMGCGICGDQPTGLSYIPGKGGPTQQEAAEADD